MSILSSLVNAKRLLGALGLQLVPRPANPGDPNTLWLNASDSNKLYRGSTAVDTGGGGSAGTYTVLSVVSSNGTTVLSASDTVCVVTGTANHTITLPAATTGKIIIVKSRTTGTVTVQRGGSDTIDGGTLTVPLSTNQSTSFTANSSDWCAI